MTLMFSTAFTAIPAYAASADSTTIMCDDFYAVKTLELNTRTSYDVELSNVDADLKTQSSDESVIKAFVKADTENPGFFSLVLEAWKAGEATVTLTTSDGTTKSQNITVKEDAVVKDSGAAPDYTISSDTTSDFSLPAQNSSYIKIHYVSDNFDTNASPTLVSDNDSVIHVERVDADSDNNDYYFRVDAIGSDGKSATLSMGSSDYLTTQKLCTVTIAENKNLRIDTQSTYACNENDTYGFIVYTTSSTPPQVNAVNSLVSVSYVGPVTGGYQYMMEAENTGNSLVEAKQGDESASFAVKINYSEKPSVVSNDSKTVNVEQGNTYTYHFAIMGGGTPKFVTGTASSAAVQSVQKNGINYTCTVAANGNPGSSSELYVTFPDGGDDSFTVDAGKITVIQQKGTYMASDTNRDFTVPYGKTYTFRITGATQFYAGSSGVFKFVNVGKSGKDTFYQITAIGKPGSATGLYMSAKDRNPVRVCVVTVGNVSLTSDTNSNISIAKGASYQYKITAPGVTNPSDIHFTAGNTGVLQTTFLKRSGNDFYYRVTATGTPGQQTGVYVSALNQAAQQINVVTVKTIEITSDTHSDFSLAKGKSYQFKITAPGASSVNFNAGSSGVVAVIPITHSGNDFFFKVTAIGKSGQSTGIYAAAPNQAAKKLCVIAVK